MTALPCRAAMTSGVVRSLSAAFTLQLVTLISICITIVIIIIIVIDIITSPYSQEFVLGAVLTPDGQKFEA